MKRQRKNNTGHGRTLVERMEMHSTPEPMSGCVLWTAARNSKGYGVLRIDHGNHYAHRVSLELHMGRRLVTGECALHRCDNPSCISPAHLFVGTHAENTADMLRKGRARGWPKGVSNPRQRHS